MKKKPSKNTSQHHKAQKLFQSNQLLDAEKIYQKITRKDKRDSVAWLMLGITQARLANYDKAITSLRQAISVNPRDFNAHVNLGQCLNNIGAPEEAIAIYRKALKITPGNPTTLVLAGNSLVLTDRIVEAEDYYEQALSGNPDDLLARGNLANVLAYQGRIPEAIEQYRQVLKADPGQHTIHSNLLLCLHYDENCDPENIFREHLEWASKQATAIEPGKLHGNDPDPDRKIRIGYVSPDLRTHSVACFTKPLLCGHDRSRFDVYCYAEARMTDESAKKIWELADTARNTSGMTDEAVAALVYNDKIDILVDLSGHTENNRLLLFARKPAPVQMTYIGYPDTTGLQAIDYRITDNQADPAGLTEHLHTEKLLRVKNGFLCFTPPEEATDETELAARKNGYITFGSFNVMTKITPDIIKTWAEILSRLPDSRILIKNRWLGDTATREKLVAVFGKHGISGDRIDISGRTTKKEHMASYGRVDLALDTYPYNGTTTTCDSLWMGIPVITRAGQTHVSRTGISLLSQIRLDELVAHTEQQYIDKAVQLAMDLPRLEKLRRGLREVMRDSSLCDEKKFMPGLEEQYRIAWKEWCHNTETGGNK